MEENYELLKIEQYDLLAETIDSMKKDYLVFHLFLNYLINGTSEERLIDDSKLLLLNKLCGNMQTTIDNLTLSTKKHSNLYVTQVSEGDE